MTGSISKSEVLSGPERRRRWAPAEKLAIVADTYEPGMSVSVVARRHGSSPTKVFSWRWLANQSALTATRAEEEVVPASEYRILQNQIRELHRLLGKKTLEAEILKEALNPTAGQKTSAAVAVVAQGRFAMKAVCEVLGVAWSNVAARAKAPLGKPRPG